MSRGTAGGDAQAAVARQIVALHPQHADDNDNRAFADLFAEAA